LLGAAVVVIARLFRGRVVFARAFIWIAKVFSAWIVIVTVDGCSNTFTLCIAGSSAVARLVVAALGTLGGLNVLAGALYADSSGAFDGVEFGTVTVLLAVLAIDRADIKGRAIGCDSVRLSIFIHIIYRDVGGCVDRDIFPRPRIRGRIVRTSQKGPSEGQRKYESRL